MRFLAFLDGTSSVRGFLVANEDGELLAETGSAPSLTWTAPRAVSVAQELTVAGALVGLGTFTNASVRGVKSARLLARGKAAYALLDLDPSAKTTELEERLSSGDWVSKTEAPIEDPDIEVIEDESDTIRPRAPVAPPRPRTVPGAPRVPAVSPVSEESKVRLSAAPAMPNAPRPSAGGLPRLVSPMTALQQKNAPAGAGPASGDGAPESSPLAPTVAQPVGPSPQSAQAVSSLAGSLRLISLPDLLEFLRVGQRSGTLVCSSAVGLGTIHLRRGRILAAASPGVPSMGDFLVEREAISRAQLQDVQRLQSQSKSSAPLTALLVAQKLVAREILQEALMFHVVQVLRKLMSWEAGDFAFEPTPTAAAGPSEHDVDLDPQGVLLNIFKDIDDAKRA